MRVLCCEAIALACALRVCMCVWCVQPAPCVTLTILRQIVDPRQDKSVATTDGQQGAKGCNITWLGATDSVLSVRTYNTQRNTQLTTTHNTVHNNTHNTKHTTHNPTTQVH